MFDAKFSADRIAFFPLARSRRRQAQGPGRRIRPRFAPQVLGLEERCLLAAAPVTLVSSVENLTQVNLDSYTNQPEQIAFPEYPDGGTLLNVGGIPFTTAHLNGTSAFGDVYPGEGTPSSPGTVDIKVNIANATTVYTLINSHWGQFGYLDGSVQFVGANGAFASFDLVQGTNVRDHAQDPRANDIVQGGTPDVTFGNGHVHLDRQTFNLPASFANTVLTDIKLNSYGGANPAQNNTTGVPWLAAAEVASAPTNATIYGQSVTYTASVINGLTAADCATAVSAVPTGTVKFMDGGTLVGSATLNNGLATLTTSTLPAGSHSITAVYSGDSTFDGGTSSAVPQLVSVAQTTTNLVSSTENLTPVNLDPYANSDLGVVPAYPNGGTVLNVGGIPFTTARFNGTNTLGIVSAGGGSPTSPGVVDIKVNIANATTVYTLIDSEWGQFGYLDGLVQFFGANGAFASFALTQGENIRDPNLSNGQANHIVSGGTPSLSFGGGTWTIDRQTFNLPSAFANTVLTDMKIYSFGNGGPPPVDTHGVPFLFAAEVATGSSTSTTYGQSVTLTSAVTDTQATTATPTGFVNFFDGSSVIGTASLVNGLAKLTTQNLPLGSHSFTAVYAGTANFGNSSSGVVTQTVTAAQTTTKLASSSGSPRSSYGQPVSLFATVSNSAGASTPPTGVVNYYDGVALIGTANLINGMASLTLSGLNVGSHAFTATYLGTANFASSTSAALNQRVVPATTLTSVAESTNTTLYGQPVTFTATVSNISSGLVPSDPVMFYAGKTLLGTAAVDAQGVASLTVSNVPGGLQSITAKYTGSSGFAPSTSPPVVLTVNPDATAGVLTSSLASTSYGQALTFSLAVSNSTTSTSVPTGGTVIFYLDYVSGQASPIVLGKAALTAGTANLTTSAIPIGSHTVTAVYVGTANFVGSTSNAVSQSVTPSTTAGLLTSSVASTTYGQAITFSLAVSNSTTTTPVPTGGTVIFYLDYVAGQASPIVLGKAALTAGTANLKTSAVPSGSHAVTAVYVGTANFVGSTSNAVSQSVTADATAGVLTSSLASTTYGQAITFSLALSNSTTSTPVPTGGTVIFYLDYVAGQSSPIVLGKAALTAGTANLTTSAVPGGSHTVTAVYVGTSNFVGSTSNAVSQSVTPDATAGVLTSSLASTTYGQAITFSLAVSNSTTSSPVPTGGTVIFYLDYVAGQASPIVLGKAALTAGTAKLTTSAVPAGSHAVTAVYVGTANFVGSTSSAVSESVLQASTTVTAANATANVSALAQAVTLSATVVSGPVSVNEGIVTFTIYSSDGKTQEGQSVQGTVVNGVVIVSYTLPANLAAGTYVIQAVYTDPLGNYLSFTDASKRLVLS